MGLALFRRPFVGEFNAANLLDHDVPQEGIDRNGVFVTFWGERILVNIDGHQGYDWLMDEGTPLFAVADGIVFAAGDEPPLDCHGRIVVGVGVMIEHRVMTAGGNLVLRSHYGHMSRVDVRVGAVVQEGQQVGLSGNTGCSTAPHLHFQVFRVDTVSGAFTIIDPYGWEGAGPDPWAQHPAGAESIWLWKDAPPIYRETRQAANTPSGSAPVTVTAVRWLGYRDDVNPNNEWVEISVDPRYAPTGSVALTGYTLKNNRGDTYAFPSGFTVRGGAPARVYTGSGQNTATTLYWGRASGVWDNLGDCVRLIDARGGQYAIRYANITCVR